jgi:hypothetical protein
MAGGAEDKPVPTQGIVETITDICRYHNFLRRWSPFPPSSVISSAFFVLF